MVKYRQYNSKEKKEFDMVCRYYGKLLGDQLSTILEGKYKDENGKDIWKDVVFTNHFIETDIDLVGFEGGEVPKLFTLEEIEKKLGNIKTNFGKSKDNSLLYRNIRLLYSQNPYAANLLMYLEVEKSKIWRKGRDFDPWVVNRKWQHFSKRKVFDRFVLMKFNNDYSEYVVIHITDLEGAKIIVQRNTGETNISLGKDWLSKNKRVNNFKDDEVEKELLKYKDCSAEEQDKILNQFWDKVYNKDSSYALEIGGV